jgi:cell division protein FtsZ
MAPTMVNLAPQPEEEPIKLPFRNAPQMQEELKEEDVPVQLHLKIKEDESEIEKEKNELEAKKQQLNDKFEQLRQNILGASNSQQPSSNIFPTSAASGGYLARPSNIYAESKGEVSTSKPAEKPVSAPVAKNEEEETFEMQLVIRSDNSAADVPMATQTQPPASTRNDEPAMQDAAEEEKRKAAERLQKLRNLSFNINAADPNNEFEAVPAYIRRNMELYNNSSSVENFYSNYTVTPDGNNGSQISTINTFLDGKKPD